MKVFPPRLVDEVVSAAGRKELRQRSLPARVVVYFVVGLALFAAESYEEVFVQLASGLSWAKRSRELVECGTHAIIDAVVGPCSTSEVALSRGLLGRLQPGMLCLADRGFYGFSAWKAAAESGADLLWRMRASQRLDPIEVLPDGSYLSKVYEVSNFKRRGDGLVVRVIDYQIEDGRSNDTSYTLITTVLDPETLSATECALAYSERWEIENSLDELKTHQRGPRTVLRSKSPPLVEQELWGHLCCHYAVRTLMWQAADHVAEDPNRVSFMTALRIVRRSMSQSDDFSPSPL